MNTIPPVPGTYLLHLKATENISLQIGRMGLFDLAVGWYIYVGSARGPGGLRARINRHMRADKPLHWHIDALTALIPVQGVWIDMSSERLECVWARRLAEMPEVREPIPSFGSSDCQCWTHLFAVPEEALQAAWEKLEYPRRLTVSSF